MNATSCGQRRATRAARMAVAMGASFMLLAAGPAFGQRQVTTGVPLRGVSDSFFERIGFSADFRAPGFTFSLGGFPQAVPQFGGFQPGAGAVGGFAFGGGKFSGRAGFEFSQGSRASNVSQTGSLTMMDGVPGIFQDVTQSPFVISNEPIVPLRGGVPWKQQLENGIVPRRLPSADADAPAAGNAAIVKPAAKAGPVRGAGGGGGDFAASQAQSNRPILSVAEIRRQREAGDEAKNTEALEHFQRAEQAERDGKPSVAKIYYQMALRRATGDLKQKTQERLANLAQ